MLVSFYILAYNHEHLISEALDAAFAQTYSPLEIVISDDCSTDRTWEVIEQRVRDYRGPHKVITRRSQRNVGIAQHINEVWQACSGDWIVASAGDDVSLPDRVQRVVEAIQSHPHAKLVQSWLNEVDASGRLLEVNRLGVEATRAFTARDRLVHLAYAAHGAAMAYSRELVDFFGPLPPAVIFEDNIVNVRAELLGELLVLAMPLVNHRNHDGQVTRIHSGSSREAQRRKIERAVVSDFESISQNAADVERARDRLPAEVYRGMVAYYRKRVWYYRLKVGCLVKPWPVRLLYLARIIGRSRQLGPFRRDDLARSLLPEPLYYRLKR